ncbi:MAG: DUF481 domain-containing protein [Desulfobacteraceae bacterium]|nr:DUF481 domain-containing protein [Desulfobacteraceae bacterium]MBC2755117.1 DUF481 domain-containing protein [Desulfobacteraceae bacterium]
MKLRIFTMLALIIIISGFFFSASAEEEKTPWSGEGEVGYFLTTGNTETSSLNAKLSINYETSHWFNEAKFIAINNSEKIENDDGSTKDKTSAEAYTFTDKAGYKFNENDYIYIAGAYEKDRFNGYDYQSMVSAGYGRRLFKNDKIMLKVEIGPGYRYDKLDSGEKNDEATLRGFGKFEWNLTETSMFEEELNVVYSSELTRTISVSSIKAQIVGALAMKLSYTFDHSSKVPAGTEKTDTITALTLVYSF